MWDSPDTVYSKVSLLGPTSGLTKSNSKMILSQLAVWDLI